MAELNTQCDVT